MNFPHKITLGGRGIKRETEQEINKEINRETERLRQEKERTGATKGHVGLDALALDPPGPQCRVGVPFSGLSRRSRWHCSIIFHHNRIKLLGRFRAYGWPVLPKHLLHLPHKGKYSHGRPSDTTRTQTGQTPHSAQSNQSTGNERTAISARHRQGTRA